VSNTNGTTSTFEGEFSAQIVSVEEIDDLLDDLDFDVPAQLDGKSTLEIPSSVLRGLVTR
jgi:hypothetical protein